ncbi:hypothetical protein ACFV2N_28285 [Streptomyces sp. NPDC059680]|uniref:hypothetical protein n=1 Tax=Streptomyces sp. NPDC059680 TaxID=3346904 RepID=UPI0036AF2BEE
MDWSKLAALGYRPARDFRAGLEETVARYRRNPDRWEAVVFSIMLGSSVRPRS